MRCALRNKSGSKSGALTPNAASIAPCSRWAVGGSPTIMSNDQPPTQDATQKTRGGPRKGAGRPRSGRVRVEVQMNPAMLREAKERSKRAGVQIGELFESLLARRSGDNPPL